MEQTFIDFYLPAVSAKLATSEAKAILTKHEESFSTALWNNKQTINKNYTFKAFL